jgi:hypothetical protein
MFGRMSLRGWKSVTVLALGDTNRAPRRSTRQPATRQPAKVTLLHTDVRMLRAHDAQEQPFAGGNEATV